VNRLRVVTRYERDNKIIYIWKTRCDVATHSFRYNINSKNSIAYSIQLTQNCKLIQKYDMLHHDYVGCPSDHDSEFESLYFFANDAQTSWKTACIPFRRKSFLFYQRTPVIKHKSQRFSIMITGSRHGVEGSPSDPPLRKSLSIMRKACSGSPRINFLLIGITQLTALLQILE
jgi:hypothetical protein